MEGIHYTVYSIPVLEHAGGTVHDMREGGHYKSPPAEKGQSHERKNTRNGEKHLQLDLFKRNLITGCLANVCKTL